MFKKILGGIKNFVLKIAGKKLVEELAEPFEAMLRKMATKNPKLFRVLVSAGYAAAKEYGQEWVASTENEVDDQALAEFMEALETVAGEFGLELKKEADELLKNEEKG